MKSSRRALAGLKNFGPVALAEFQAMGIEYLHQIADLGFEETCRLWIQHFPERLNANAFLGIVCSLDGVVWTQATYGHRAAAHALARQLRQELGLPQVKTKRARKSTLSEPDSTAKRKVRKS
ncbi:MAG: hypothetical protein ACK5Y2_02985 [Bdellovibrionales bacterium]